MNHYYSRIREVCSDRYLVLTLLAAGLYAVIFSLFSIEKHISYHSGLDLAIYEQLLWTTIHHGTLFYNTLEGMESFGVHFSPVLFTLLPAYYLVPQTVTLLVIQSLLLGVAAVPLYYLGRLLLNERAGFIIALSYLMYPALQGVNLTDFHIICFAPVFFFSAFYFIHRHNFRYFLLFAILLICVREDLIPVVALLSLYAAWFMRKNQRDFKPYIILATAAALWFLMVMLAIMPSFLPASHAGEITHLSRYQGTIEGLSQNQSYRLTHVFLLFGPLLLLPLAAPGVLLTGLSAFLEIFLSPNPFYYSIEYQYSALIIPSIFAATVITLAKVKNSPNKNVSKKFNHLVLALLVTGVLFMLLFSPSPIRSGPFADPYNPTITSHHQILDKILSGVPAGSAIGTQDDLLPHLSKRDHLYRGFDENADFIIADNQTKFIDIFSTTAEKLGEWPVIYSNGGVTVFQHPDSSGKA